MVSIELAGQQFVGKSGGQIPEERIFSMSDGEILVLCSSGDDLNEALDFGLVVETHAEQLDGGVVDVVVGGDHAQVERGSVHVLLDADALAVLQLGQRVLYHLGQVVRQVSVGDALHVVVVGVIRLYRNVQVR